MCLTGDPAKQTSKSGLRLSLLGLNNATVVVSSYRFGSSRHHTGPNGARNRVKLHLQEGGTRDFAHMWMFQSCSAATGSSGSLPDLRRIMVMIPS